MVLYKYTLDVILVYLDIFVISLVVSTYISSFKLVASVNLLVYQSLNKLGAKFPLPLVCDFLSFLLHFLALSHIQTPLDDDKSRDVWLRPLVFEEEGHWVPVLR